MLTITSELLESVEEFKNNLHQYKVGELTEFKPFSARMGIYKEGPKDTFMIRPRIPGGVITLEQLKALNEIAKKYAGGKMRFTTRQDIQLHSVRLDDLDKVLEELIKEGFTTKAAGGDGVRNAACSPLSGVQQGEAFDVTPYMLEVCNYMLIDPDNVRLPRKFKISFSSHPEDTAHATIADIGFIAKIVAGQRGFEVYGGGGLGVGARIALKLEDFIPDSEALYYIQAMRNVFAKEGDRTNRQKARLRFVVQRLGEKDFIALFKEELQLVKSNPELKLHITPEEISSTCVKENEMPLDKRYQNSVIPQKQAGLYSVYLHPQNGNMLADRMDEVIAFLEKLGYKTSIRTTMTQGFYVRDLQRKDIASLLKLAETFSSVYDIDNSITCAGPTICNFGINNSQGMLNKIIETFKNETFDIKNALPRIHISGCYNSCGHHQKGLIGLTGKRKRTEDGVVPMYTILFNGKVGANATFGQVYGEIPAKKIPKFLLELAYLKASSGYYDFNEFVQSKELAIKELVLVHSTIETIDSNPDLYLDFK